MKNLKFKAIQPSGEWMYSDQLGLDLFFANVVKDKLTPLLYAGRDRDNKDIYEGDIVKRDHTYLVIFHSGCFWCENIKTGFVFSKYPSNEYKLVGNIIDNPELMEI